MADLIKLDGGGTGSASTTPTPSIPKINLDGPAGSAGSGTAAIQTPAPTAPTSAGGMGNIFTQSQGQVKKEESKMISSVLSLKDVGQKTKSILGAAPTLEKSIEQGKEAALKRKLRTVQFAFLLVVVSAGLMVGYFYSELSPTIGDFSFFGSNTTQRLTDTNANIRQIQTTLNKDRYLAAQFKLNEFNYEADLFFSSLDANAQQSMPALLTAVRGDLTKNLVADTYRTSKEPEQSDEEKLQKAQEDLRNALREEKKKYGKNPTAQQEISDIKLIDNALKLVGNAKLMNVLQTTSADAFQKQLADYSSAPTPEKLKALQDLIAKILASTKSDLATIAEIKRNRIEWSAIIGHIKEETLNVGNSNFDQPLAYEQEGGIVYNGYEFESATDKIVLSGATKTQKGTNFTLMSNLIDHLEASPYFQEVEMRSFSKSKASDSDNGAYIANFKIDLRLQTRADAEKDPPISLKNKPLQEAVGAGRTADVATPVAPPPAPLGSVVETPSPVVTVPPVEKTAPPVAPVAPPQIPMGSFGSASIAPMFFAPSGSAPSNAAAPSSASAPGTAAAPHFSSSAAAAPAPTR